MAKLLLARHGMTQLYHENRFWGKTDVPLSAIGIRQAEQLRDRLAVGKISAVYASTLSRASDTAQIIASPHKQMVKPHEELCECNFGFIEGLTFDEIQNNHPELAEELSNWKTVAFPGGESLDELNNRLQPFLEQLKEHKPKDTVLVVAHGGPLRLMICGLMGIGIKHWLHMRIDLASLSIVETYPEGNILTLLNDTSHLKP